MSDERPTPTVSGPSNGSPTRAAQSAAAQTSRDRLLDCGQELMLLRGYHDTGLTEILRTAEVPKGSFYHHFGSKEDFGLAVIDRFAARSGESLTSHLGRRDLPPLERLRGYFEASLADYQAKDFQGGCLLGMLGQEMSLANEPIRRRIRDILRGIIGSFADCYREAVAEGSLPSATDPETAAQALADGWQGAQLRMKIERSAEPIHAFLHHHFAQLAPSS